MTSVRPAPALVDSNILVYFVDEREPVKKGQAELLLARLVEAERMVLSAQCLSEFYRVTTRRLHDRVSPAMAASQVATWAEACTVLNLTSDAVVQGCRKSAGSQMAIWDALIWAVAKTNGIRLVLTEDLPGGRTQDGLSEVDGVRYLNPFAPDFDLDSLF